MPVLLRNSGLSEVEGAVDSANHRTDVNGRLVTCPFMHDRRCEKKLQGRRGCLDYTKCESYIKLMVEGFS